MAKTLKQVALGAIGVCTLAGTLKIAKITSDDDWELVRYKAKKMLTFGGGKKTKQQKPKVVVLGTGWGSISFIHQLDLDEVDLTIVSPRSYFFYTPLLAGTATGTVSSSSIIEPIRWYCESESGAKFVQAECTGVDVKGKVISCRGSDSSSVPSFSMPYDHLVIAVGAEPATFNIPGVKEHATFMKEIEDGVSVKRQILQKLENAHSMLVAGVPQSEVDKQLTWIVVGGGPTGVELCAEITDFINADVKRYFPSLVPHINVMLVEALPRVLTMFDDRMSSYATESLKQNGAKVLCGAMVSKVTPDEVQLKIKDQTQVASFNYGILVWAGGIAMRPLTKTIAGQLQNQNSRFGLEVDTHLHVKGCEDGSLWAIGDCAVNGCAPTAQAANQQGQVQ
jgi:NADH:ubiquinone reductase (non-electrogenic)